MLSMKLGIVSQPETSYKLLAGIEQVINAVRPTIGPLPRMVAVNNAHQQKPELLDSAALIARRIFALPDRSEDVGAMYLRHLLWKQQERYGDGTATTALIFHHIYSSGLRYVAAGGNTQSLKRYLLLHLERILSFFDQQVIPMNSQKQYKHLAQSIGSSKELATPLAEILDVIGAYGRLEVIDGRSKDLNWTFIEGLQWNSGVHQRDILPQDGGLELVKPAILLTDQKIDKPTHLAPAMTAAFQSGYHSLLILTPELSHEALGFIYSNNQRHHDVFQIVPNRIPGNTETDKANALHDIATVTGAQTILSITGRELSSVTATDFGTAQRVRVSEKYLGIIGGKGDPLARQQLANSLKARLKQAQTGEADVLRHRLGRLIGGTAVLAIGANSLAQMEERKELVKRIFPQLQRASLGGIVAGGGVGLLNCKQALVEQQALACDLDEQFALRILSEAMEAPMLQILENAGLQARPMLHRVEMSGKGYGVDTKSEQIKHMLEVGIVDAAVVWRSALETAVRSAALALTVDVIVHHHKPEISLAP